MASQAAKFLMEVRLADATTQSSCNSYFTNPNKATRDHAIETTARPSLSTAESRRRRAPWGFVWLRPRFVAPDRAPKEAKNGIR